MAQPLPALLSNMNIWFVSCTVRVWGIKQRASDSFPVNGNRQHLQFAILPLVFTYSLGINENLSIIFQLPYSLRKAESRFYSSKYQVSKVYFLSRSFAYSSGRAKAWLEKGLGSQVQSPRATISVKLASLAKQIAVRHLLNHAFNHSAVLSPSYTESLRSITFILLCLHWTDLFFFFLSSCHNHGHGGGYKGHKNQRRHSHTFLRSFLYICTILQSRKKKKKQ